MADTTFVNNQTVIDATWLNDVNDLVYDIQSTANGKGASLVKVEDPAENFVATDVEGVLSEIATDITDVEATLSELYGYTRDLTNYGPGILNGIPLVWQDGTSFAAAANATYIADNWMYEKTGAMVHTCRQSTDVPTVALAGVRIPYAIEAEVTTADTSIDATDFSFFTTFIEGYDFNFYAQRQITIGFLARSSTTGVHCVSARSGGADRSYVGEFIINTANTWESKTVTLSASPSAGTWDYTNGKGLTVSFAMAAGANYQTTKDAWQTGNFIGTASQVNACATIGNKFAVCGVRIFSGAIVPAQFWPGELFNYHKQLAKAQRYKSIGSQIFSGDVTSANAYHAVAAYPVEMRAQPTVTISEIANSGFASGGGTVNYDAPATRQFRYTKTANATVGGAHFHFTWTAKARF